MSQYRSPFLGLTATEIYKMLSNRGEPRDSAIPRWPSPDIQRKYVGLEGVEAVQRAMNFIDLLAEDGAFTPAWKGVDYGCGFGRIASLMLIEGNASQLDLCDAWPQALTLLESGGFKNERRLVSEQLREGELPSEK